MERLILKQEYVEIIKDDAELYGKIAKSLGITAPSLRAVLKANSPKLTQAAPMLILKDHVGVAEYSELLTSLSVEA